MIESTSINFEYSALFIGIGIGIAYFIVISFLIFIFVCIGTFLRSLLPTHGVAVDFAFATIALFIIQYWYVSTTGKSIGDIEEIVKMMIISLIGAALDAHLLGIFKVILSCNK